MATEPPSGIFLSIMRKTPLVTGEFYHIYNRGVDKRNIFFDNSDKLRFFKSMHCFNTVKPIGSLFENNFRKEKSKEKPLIRFVAYCLLENHFHFLIEQMVDNGISQYMKRLLGGYTWYFNNRHKRWGALFQGAFKSKHIDSNETLLHISAYVNLNDKQKMSLGDRTAKLSCFSSWHEYGGEGDEQKLLPICDGKDTVLDQFKSAKLYKDFALSAFDMIIENKEKYKELEDYNSYLAVRSPNRQS